MSKEFLKIQATIECGLLYFSTPETLPAFSLATKSHALSKWLFFSDVILVSNYNGPKETIKLIPYYMIYIIYKTVKLSQLKKMTNHTKYKLPNVSSHLHFF